MTHKEYWIEGVSEALCHMEMYEKFTPAQIEELAEAMMISAECEGQAFGHDAIPNPLRTDLDRVNSEKKKADEAHEKDRHDLFLKMCKLADVYPERVFLNRDNELEYRR